MSGFGPYSAHILKEFNYYFSVRDSIIPIPPIEIYPSWNIDTLLSHVHEMSFIAWLIVLSIAIDEQTEVV